MLGGGVMGTRSAQGVDTGTILRRARAKKTGQGSAPTAGLGCWRIVMSKNKYGGINDTPYGWTKDETNKRIYSLWFAMLRRCYDKEQQSRTKGRAYKDCTVCDRWMSLSNFCEDITKLPGYSEWLNGEKMSIDKDLFSGGGRIYSPKTCCFVPMAVNISEMGRRNIDNIRALNEKQKTKYMLIKGDEQLVFNSEMEACNYLGVVKCSVSSCYHKGYKCKGYTIAKMDLEG